MLLVRGHVRERPPACLVRSEDGVVAKPGVALLAHRDRPRADPLGEAATAAGDDTVLARLAESDYRALGDGPTGLMARAVMCATGLQPGARLPDANRAETVFGEPVDNEFLSARFCAAIDCRGLSPEFAGPVRSNVPALFITGSLDCTTPLSNADQVRSGFPHAIAVEVENGGHETLPVPAVQAVVVAFFRGGPEPAPRIAAAPPRFASIAEAKQVRAARGR